MPCQFLQHYISVGERHIEDSQKWGSVTNAGIALFPVGLFKDVFLQFTAGAP